MKIIIVIEIKKLKKILESAHKITDLSHPENTSE